MKIINPLIMPIVVEGPLFYQQTDRCFNIIRLQKKIIKEFPELKTADKVYYKIELWKGYDELEQRIKEIIRKRQVLPLLLFFYTETAGLNGKQK